MQLRRKKRKKLPRILAIFLVLLLLGAVGTAAFMICRVENITVEGISKFTQEQIIGMSGIQMNDSMFLLNDAAICSAMQKDPYIQSVNIEKQFPETVKVVVIERKPTAEILYLDSNYKMDAEGYMLEKMDTVADGSCPIISGMNVSSFQIGKEIKSEDPQQVEAYKTIITKLNSSTINSDISEINIANLENIYLISHENIKIRIGNLTDLDKKITWIKNVLPILVQQSKSGGTLDVTNPASASYIP